MRCEPTRRRPVGATDVTNRVICKKTARSLRKKRSRAPLVEGASFSQIGAGEDQAENPSTWSSRASDKPFQVKGTPYLNPDPFCRFIGPRNWGEALIDDKLMTCLLDNGSQLNFVTPTYAHERGMDILSLDTLTQEIGGQLPPIAVMGGGMIKPEGFVIMNVQVPCVRGTTKTRSPLCWKTRR